eukprot:1646254-Pleurochrysis_carterae.AAC.1
MKGSVCVAVFKVLLAQRLDGARCAARTAMRTTCGSHASIRCTPFGYSAGPRLEIGRGLNGEVKQMQFWYTVCVAYAACTIFGDVRERSDAR